MATSPLDGLNVLDLSRVLAGPLCTMILGDLGANVIKVERPRTGDDTRHWGPPFDARGESAYYLAINRNKMSVAADLAAPDDRDLIRRLIADADVVVDNFRPGVLERHALSAEELLRRHRGLVWCTIAGFPDDQSRPGYDFVIQAEAGWMAITGAPAGEPMKIGVALADVLAGKDAAVAILAALVARGTGSEAPRRVSVSLLESARAALINVAQNAMVSGSDASRWGNAHPNLVPYQLFHASDRPVVVAVGTDAQWRAFAHAVGLPELADDARAATNAQRVAHRAWLVNVVGAALARRGAAEWVEVLRASDVPCGVVKSIAEVIAETAGSSALAGMPSSVGGSVRLPPPRLDEHGAAIRRLGWAAFEHA